ncbi:MAG TPA: hypothetical protein VNK43_01860 [Gemmatimonadales bacterium]|nr:hypothetical protein [Gemmatimonadales bacterium]
MNGPEVLVPISFFATIAAIFIARSRIGEAIAERIRRGTGGGAEELRFEVDRLRQELDAMRQELLETQERVDFAERLLVRGTPAEPRAEG